MIRSAGQQSKKIPKWDEVFRYLTEKLKQNTITENEAQKLLFDLFGINGKFYSDKEIEQIKYKAFCQGIVDNDNDTGYE